MALFKIFKGNKNKLGAAPQANEQDTRYAHEGFAYFTTDDGKFYIDIAGNTGDNNTLAVVGTNRIPLSADKADKDESGNNIKASYGATLDIEGHTLYLKNKNGAAIGNTITLPDNNTTYTIATGDANGQIKVTPSSGSAYNVSVKGLGSNAYTSTAYLPLAGGTMTGMITFPAQDACCNEKNIKFSSGGYIGGDVYGNIGVYATAIYLRAGNKDASSAQGLIMTSGTQLNPYADNAFTLGTSSLRFKNIYAVAFTGSGASLTSLNASNISSGTLAAARLPTVTRTNNTSTAAPAHGATFTALDSITTDSYGRVTAINTKTITLPADNNTDTKVNVVARGTTKAYLLATTTSPTSTAQAVTSVAETGVYLDTTAGKLVTTALDVSGVVNLNGETTADSLTTGNLLVTGVISGHFNHKLTIGSYEFDGSADVIIPIYNGATS